MKTKISIPRDRAQELPGPTGGDLQKCWLTATVEDRELSSTALYALADQLEASAAARAALLKDARRFDRRGVLKNFVSAIWPQVIDDIRRRAYQKSPAGRAEQKARLDAAEAGLPWTPPRSN